MRAPFLMLPLTLALAAPLAAMAEDTPRVLFCSGECFAVGADGVRTPAPKGTQLLPGQRLETGRGSYAQVRLGADAAFGIGERARVRLDSNGVFLDEGRIRVVGGEAIGKITRPVELRTDDSTFVLRGADIEIKKSGPTGPASPVLVKLNAGDATVSGAALTNGGVQLVTNGSVIPGAPLSSTELAAATPGKSTGPVAQAGGLTSAALKLAPVALRPIGLPPTASLPRVPPTLNLPPQLTRVARPPEVSPLPMAPRLLSAPVINLNTGELVTLNTALILTVQPTYSYATLSPTLIDSKYTTSLSSSLLTSPTLSTTTLSSATSLSGTTSLSGSTILTSPILTTTTVTSPTTTTTTNFSLISSPTTTLTSPTLTTSPFTTIRR